MQRRSVEREQAPLPALSIQPDSCVLRTRSEPSIHPQKPLISNDPAEGTVARRLPKQPTDRTPARELPEDTSTLKVLRPVIGIASLGLLAATLLATPVAAQHPDSRWQAFLGCWEPTGRAAEAGLLCVRPLEGVVELFTVIAGKIATSDTMVANGAQRLRSLEGCEGWESSEFSDDGLRLFTHSDFVCGEEIPRSSAGVMPMISPTMWVDVRSVEVGGEPVAWVQRYSLVGPLRMTGAGVEDVTQSRALAVESARLSAPG